MRITPLYYRITVSGASLQCIVETRITAWNSENSILGRILAPVGRVGNEKIRPGTAKFDF